ncbi:MAG: recombinase family protein [Oscillospiraceae bacterium]|nr:recombinase family protein [Oscillospiraceae bacterium]
MLKNRNIPFGYCIRGGEYAVNEIEAEAIRQIFARYIGGDSLKTIAAKLTVPYNACKPVWNKNMVSRVLENRRYLGENGYPAIISQEDFDTANQIKATRYIKGERKESPPGTEQRPIRTIYEPTEEIQKKTNEIARMLDTPDADKDEIIQQIFRCAEMKYAALKPIYDGGDTND